MALSPQAAQGADYPGLRDQINALQNGSANYGDTSVALVRPYGNNSRATIGGFPFHTVQGAIDAFEAGSYIFPLIDIGNNDCTEDLTTSLPTLGIRSVAGSDDHYAFHSLTATGGGLDLSLSHCYSNPDGTLTVNGNLNVSLHDAGLNGPVVTTAGNVICQSQGNFYGTYGGFITDVTAHGFINIYGLACQGQLTSNTSGDISITDSPFLAQFCIIDSAGSNVYLTRALVYRIKVSVNNVSLVDSRVTFSNAAAGATTYNDQLLAKLHPTILILPTTDPHVIGALWNNSTVVTVSTG